MRDKYNSPAPVIHLHPQQLITSNSESRFFLKRTHR